MEALEKHVTHALSDMRGYRMVDKADPGQTEKRLWFEPRDAGVRLRWGLIFGDAIQNIRSGLDHLIWGLTIRNGHTPPANPIPFDSPWTKLQFPLLAQRRKNAQPWRTNPPGSLWGIADQPVLLDFIETKQPYHHGPAAEALSVLRELSNINKHRAISLLGIRTDALLVQSDAGLGETYRLEEAPPGTPDAEMTLPPDLDSEGVEVNFRLSVELVLDDGEPAEHQAPEDVYADIRSEVVEIVDFVAANLPPARPSVR